MHNHCTLVKGATNHTVALSPNERRHIINTWFATHYMTRRLQPKTWGGLWIADALPREGRRVHKHEPWDEANVTHFAD